MNAQETFDAAMALEKETDFQGAKKKYADLVANVSDEALLAKAKNRLEDMDDLIAEKEIYERIDENGKRVLTEIGINISENQTLMDLLMNADAVDYENETAVFIPIKRDYIDKCLDLCPRDWSGNPGPNTFGTGATPPFLKRSDSDDLRQANRQEFEHVVRTVAENSDVVGIFSLPVATDKSISAFEVAQLMEKHFEGLKMTTTKAMSDDELTFLQGKDHWVDGTSLITSLAPMNTMVEPFLRSCRSGHNLLLLDLAIAGSSAAGSPESLLTQIHAQVLFMIVVAQTVNPGVLCLHGGIPGVTEAGGDLSYSSPHQPLTNAAMARVNTWINKLPGAQSGGSTSIPEVTQGGIIESELSRNLIRKYGAHIIRHAMGALGSLNFFSVDKFLADCERERNTLKLFAESPKDKGVLPMYFPPDNETMAGIREIAERGNPKAAEHTLRNVDSFMKWEKKINDAARMKLYYPNIKDTVIEMISKGDVIP